MYLEELSEHEGSEVKLGVALDWSPWAMLV